MPHDLSRLPLFQGLEPDTAASLEQACQVRSLHEGTFLVQQGQEADELFVLTRGEVSIVQDGNLTRLVPAPAVLGLPALFGGHRRTASIVARTDVQVAILSRPDAWALFQKSPIFARNVVQSVTEDLVRMYEREAQWQRYMADFFQSPNARLVPGPYAAEPYEMIFLEMEGDPESLQRLLPEGLSPIPGMERVYFLTFNFFNKVFTSNPAGEHKSFAYNETSPFLPVLSPGLRPGFYIPEIYLDNYLAIALGREIYGFPKRFGITTRRGRQVDLVVDNRHVCRARWSAETHLDSRSFLETSTSRYLASDNLRGWVSRALAPLYDLAMEKRMLRIPVLVEKQIPDVLSEIRNVYSIDSLVEIPFEVTTLRRTRKLEDVEVSFLDTGHFLRGQCRQGLAMEIGFAFGRGHQRIDYRGQRGRVRHALQGLVRNRREDQDRG